MISSAVPLSAIARELEDRLPNLTSSQLPILIPLLRNLGARCDEIEKALKPAAVAPRPRAACARPRRRRGLFGGALAAGIAAGP